MKASKQQAREVIARLFPAAEGWLAIEGRAGTWGLLWEGLAAVLRVEVLDGLDWSPLEIGRAGRAAMDRVDAERVARAVLVLAPRPFLVDWRTVEAATHWADSFTPADASAQHAAVEVGNDPLAAILTARRMGGLTPREIRDAIAAPEHLAEAASTPGYMVQPLMRGHVEHVLRVLAQVRGEPPIGWATTLHTGLEPWVDRVAREFNRVYSGLPEQSADQARFADKVAAAGYTERTAWGLPGPWSPVGGEP